MVLTTDALHFALAAEPGVVADLEVGDGDPDLASFVATSSWTRARESVPSLRLVTGRLVVGGRPRKEIVFDRDHHAALEDCFRSLADHLDLGPVREAEASWWEAARTPILGTLLTALSGSSLLLLAGPGQHPWLAGVSAGAVLFGVGWCVARMQRPPRVLVARGCGGAALEERPPLAEDEFRQATATLLGVAPAMLRIETRFFEDLGIPPGVLLEAVDELADEFGRDCPDRAITTFGELVAAFR